MRSELFLSLKEKGRLIGDVLRRKPPVETDIVDLVTNIDEYRGKKVKVIGDAEFADEKVEPKFTSGMTMHPITVSETLTYHRLYPPHIIGAEVNILFQEGLLNTAGEAPRKGDLYIGRVAVTGRVKMETVKENGEALGIGTIKAPRPYIKATEVKLL